jgi:hypothetical protein
MELHCRKERETETGGEPTPYNSPLMFEMNSSKTGFTNALGRLMFTPLFEDKSVQPEINLDLTW